MRGKVWFIALMLSSWSKIVKISFKRKQFFIQLRKELTETYDTLLGQWFIYFIPCILYLLSWYIVLKVWQWLWSKLYDILYLKMMLITYWNSLKIQVIRTLAIYIFLFQFLHLISASVLDRKCLLLKSYMCI